MTCCVYSVSYRFIINDAAACNAGPLVERLAGVVHFRTLVTLTLTLTLTLP